LYQNYPNPFNPATTVRFDVPAGSKNHMSNVKIAVYDILGREVAELLNEDLSPGTYEANWDASNQPSGVYFCNLITNNFTATKKMMLIK